MHQASQVYFAVIKLKGLKPALPSLAAFWIFMSPVPFCLFLFCKTMNAAPYTVTALSAFRLLFCLGLKCQGKQRTDPSLELPNFVYGWSFFFHHFHTSAASDELDLGCSSCWFQLRYYLQVNSEIAFFLFSASQLYCQTRVELQCGRKKQLQLRYGHLQIFP